GFRWGTSLLPGEAITMEHLLDQTAITYPFTTVTNMTGETIKTVLEDVADNLFNPDPYYQQGGDMVRVGGLQYAIDPAGATGKRISEMRLNGKLIEAGKTYKVAGWAPVSEEAKAAGGEAIWDLMARHLKEVKTKSRGVRFEVCEITLRNRSLKKEQFTLDAEFTPSGVVRIADLQYKDKYAYIRP
ncbi:MAG: hypothetical protein EBV36_07035, partial [Burkholderiaceae bacterium]|nr:hypothetical protein [Burkholderiaceae bacterium]